MARLFAGLEIPFSVNAELARLQQFVPSASRLSSPANWHLTLAFIGEAELSLAHAALTGRAYNAPRIALTEPGWFGSRESRTYWLGAERTPGLCALHQALHGDLRAIGLEPDDKPFVPHITLARGRGSEHEEEVFRQQLVTPGLEFHPREFCLYSSEPQANSSVYRVEARYRLN